MQANIFGKRSEIIATDYLKRHGYTILRNNFKCSIGEIDIICRQGDCLVFVEVKARTSRLFGDPLEAINQRKQQKIRQVASVFMNMVFKKEVKCRFDAIAILGETDEQIRHIENAF